ncbi:CHAT domain-containing protein, partial [Streptomyces clavuligerus]
SGTENGGLQGVRAWARDVADRADALLPGTAAERPHIARLPPVLAELAEVARFLTDTPEDLPLRAALEYRRGALLTLRGSGPAALPGDLEEAERLLRAARTVLRERPGMDGPRAALYQFMAMRDRPGLDGRPVDSASVLDWALSEGAGGFDDRAGELASLLMESVPAMSGDLSGLLSDAEREQLDATAAMMSGALKARTIEDLDRPDLLGKLPEGHPFRDGIPEVVRALFAGVDIGAESDAPADGGEPSADSTDSTDSTDGPDRSAPERTEAVLASALSLYTTLDSGAAASAEVRKLLAKVDGQLRQGVPGAETEGLLATFTSVWSKATRAMSEGSPDALDEAIGVLRGTLGALSADDPFVPALRQLQSVLLQLATDVGGSIQDAEMGRSLVDQPSAEATAAQFPQARLVGLKHSLDRAVASRDIPALARLIDELESLPPMPAPMAAIRPTLLGQALLSHGRFTQDRRQQREGLRKLREGIDSAESAAPLLRPLMKDARIALSAAEAELEADPDILRRTLAQADDAAAPPRRERGHTGEPRGDGARQDAVSPKGAAPSGGTGTSTPPRGTGTGAPSGRGAPGGGPPSGTGTPVDGDTPAASGSGASGGAVAPSGTGAPGGGPPSGRGTPDGPAEESARRTGPSSWVIGTGHVLLYGQTRDPDDLDRAVEELERARAAARPAGLDREASQALWRLATAYQSRWALGSDLHAATRAAMESLRATAASVLLQSGAEHGLRVAREGTARTLVAAGWAASSGWVSEAVSVLEFGRAMVLHAAAASADLPELLVRRGHSELADAWRARPVSPRDPADLAGLPSTLRRRVLEALGHHGDEGGPFTAPTVEELRTAVATVDADALVYLLPPERGRPGHALVIGPDVEAGVLILPQLADDRTLDAYLDAAAARSQRSPDTPAEVWRGVERTWEEALEALCDWAWQAMGPLLRGLGERIAANPDRRTGRPGGARLILVPCGRLGVVPWHAARFQRAPGGAHSHLCSLAHITYAASGAQFLRAVSRAARPADSAPVLIADPRMDLVGAEEEIVALHRSCYPGATLYGEFCDTPVTSAGAGTPAEVLSLLSPGSGTDASAPLSLLHVASHAWAGVHPTVSALALALPEGAEEPPFGQGGPDTPPDPGMLTVSDLLDGAEDTGERAADGPLVVLSACETDLSQRDHDEALTLATAFIARGARDVVGSRWTVPDGASSVLMAVFHHLLTVDGLAPPDALRGAQLWMLDPDRRPPSSLRGELLRQASRPELARIAAWAGFIHQGHPGNNGPRSRPARTAAAP